MNRAQDALPSSADAPYATLTPAGVLDALDSVGLRGDGRLIQLNSYENRVFQVFLEDGSVVVTKFYRPARWSDAQILEEHRFAAELAAAEVPVIAPLVLSADPNSPLRPVLAGEPATLATVVLDGATYRFAVAPRRSGRAPSLETTAPLEWIGRFIGRMHAIGAREPFRFRHTLTIDEFGRAPRDWLREHDIVPPEALPAWLQSVDRVLDLVQAAFDRVGPVPHIRLHGDCHIGNLLWTDAGPHFVDLDDALNGPAVQDLWMLLSGEEATARWQLRALLSGYEQFMAFDDRELALLEPLRGLRLIHHSAWIARRWNDPAFPVAFPWFGGAAYWQQQTQLLREHEAALLRSASL
jgi:Ser/Thr protein kinase RdoA (MazF antagonist)